MQVFSNSNGVPRNGKISDREIFQGGKSLYLFRNVYTFQRISLAFARFDKCVMQRMPSANCEFHHRIVNDYLLLCKCVTPRTQGHIHNLLTAHIQLPACSHLGIFQARRTTWNKRLSFLQFCVVRAFSTYP